MKKPASAGFFLGVSGGLFAGRELAARPAPTGFHFVGAGAGGELSAREEALKPNTKPPTTAETNS